MVSGADFWCNLHDFCEPGPFPGSRALEGSQVGRKPGAGFTVPCIDPASTVSRLYADAGYPRFCSAAPLLEDSQSCTRLRSKYFTVTASMAVTRRNRKNKHWSPRKMQNRHTQSVRWSLIAARGKSNAMIVRTTNEHVRLSFALSSHLTCHELRSTTNEHFVCVYFAFCVDSNACFFDFS